METQDGITELLSKYEEADSAEIRYYEIIKIWLAEIFDFSKIQNDIYTYLIGRINAEESAIQFYPDHLKTSLSDLFNLKNKGCFAEISITDIIQDIDKDIKGVFPEIDWMWFNDRSDDVMERLLRHRTSGTIKQYFAKTAEDKKIIDDFITRMFDEGKVKLIKDLK